LGSNAAADDLFDSTVKLHNGRLKVSDERAHQQLEAFYRRSDLFSETDSIFSDPIVVRRPQKSLLVLRAIPVPVAARGPFIGAQALLVSRDLDAREIPKAGMLQAAFNLTPAETRLAERLAAGASVELVAQELRLSRATVRNQLRSLF